MISNKTLLSYFTKEEKKDIIIGAFKDISIFFRIYCTDNDKYIMTLLE